MPSTTRRFRERSAVLPIAAGVLYLVVFVVRFGDIVRTGMLNGDTASGPVLAWLAGEAPSDREIVLGNFPWAVSLWTERAIGWLPAHRTLWEVGPYAVAVVTIVLVTAGAARVTRRSLAVSVTGVILLCAGPWTVLDVGSWTLHGPAWLAVALASWVVVWTASERWTPRPAPVAGAIAIGVAIGANAASDPLTWLGAVVPLAAAGWAAGPHARASGRAGLVLRRPGLAAVVAGIVVGAVATVGAMAIQDLRAADYPLGAAAPYRWRHNVEVLGRSLAGLGNGDVWGSFGGPAGVHAVGLALTAAAIVAVTWAVARTSPAIASRTGTPERRAYVVFWATSALSLIASFLGTTAPEWIWSGRYLVGVLLAVAALLALVAERGAAARAVVHAGAAAFACVGIVALAAGEMTANTVGYPEPPLARQLAAFAEQRGMTTGYASYWDAMALTWHGGERGMRVYPVQECAPRHGLCPMGFHRISTWYRPRPRTSTFLVIDPVVKTGPLTGVDPRLGPPASIDRVGPLVVYTFSYDIAARMGGVSPSAGAL
jgi:hypothetical protein